ncbi:TPA: DUF3850 domain-containing protein [Enterococcus faecalis]|uniref:DUF3850 domain-containing protein n=1 Tax=Enterococcus TaxID=1350 RepID=UPI0011593487|nr:DUF3850 domain-containing protein [Enterococcus faecalis]MBT2155426.1 DUF3850 domain-containing protein [Enterococcus faecalis]MCD4933534.1 DUF3850 domain-containing protein [Enterococcus faecalis]MUN86551.1 DUF3850 domain-containing protein [Enterococcus faecalis]UER66582.1 DUF3850 domain-containing protein [Enterococcus faecalis]HCT8905282.1 DUF3850 domain-containing protein [Enterococcus faecalis]
MNKQELIEELECLEVPTDSLDYLKGANYAVEKAISLAKQLDEPKKVVVPKFVADWIEYAKKKGVSLIVSFNPWDLYGAEYIEATRWIDNNQETFALAWVNGYEVETEPAIHELKILPEYFEAVVSGNKCFEIRKNDRNYKKGDILRLNEYQDGQYTGDVHVAEITYITDYAQQDGYVVLGIK